MVLMYFDCTTKLVTHQKAEKTVKLLYVLVLNFNSSDKILKIIVLPTKK